MATQQQIREQITQQIITALETGSVPPWRHPWRLGLNAGFPGLGAKPRQGLEDGGAFFGSGCSLSPSSGS